MHTVLVDMRARLRESQNPNRIFDAILEVAKQAGLIGRKRVLDSTALYDAVATQDTVTLIRSAIRGLLQVTEADLEKELRAVLKRDDDYRSRGKPCCDWDDVAAREELVDALARDAYAVLGYLDGRKLEPQVEQAAQLVATVVGQDLEQRQDGLFRIARGVAENRVISTVDPEARHGHKTAARGFDGYKGHVSVDPDSELIVATQVTAANVGDGSVAMDLLAADLKRPVGDKAAPVEALAVKADLCHGTAESVEAVEEVGAVQTSAGDSAVQVEALAVEADPCHGTAEPVEAAEEREAVNKPVGDSAVAVEPLEIYGDASYGTAELVEEVEAAGAVVMMKVQAPSGKAGMFTKQVFTIDVDQGTVTCPAGNVAKIRVGKEGGGQAAFGGACAACPLRAQCTEAKGGASHQRAPQGEDAPEAARAQKDPAWRSRYKATRPKVERKQAEMMLRRHGGRRARVRGSERVGHDFALLGAAVNLKRVAKLGVRHQHAGWTRS